MKEALLYKKLKNKKVNCLTCRHNCVIENNKRGLCAIRENKNGILFLLTYSKAIAENIDPIEKKPLYHFLPGTQTLTVATQGCNFRCKWCQNYDISQGHKELVPPYPEIPGSKLSPDEIVEHALENDCPSISYSYTEPTVWLEYALDTMKLAHETPLRQGSAGQDYLKNIWVSNGYMSKETLNLIMPYLDAINIDIKSIHKKKFQEFVGAVEPEFVLDNCEIIVKNNIHLEITTLIIPKVNDSKKELTEIAEFIAKKLGKNIPWHLSRYYPTYKMEEPTTPTKTLKMAEKIGKKAGLQYIYIENV